MNSDTLHDDSLPPRRCRVLVADDDPEIADVLAAFLTAGGHTVRVARDGNDALHIAQFFAPEIAFLDIGMPGLSGDGVSKGIRMSKGMRDCVLVAVTGLSSEQDRARTRNAGFDHHLAKPVDFADIARIVLATPAPA